MFAKLLGFAFQMVGVLWMFLAGGYGVYRYERLPVGWPNYEVKCCLVVHFAVHMPGAGSVTADKARYAALTAQEAAVARHSAVVVQRQGVITAAVSAHQTAVQTQIKWRTQILLKEIHDAVPPASDRAFPLSVGWVRSHDSFARGVDLSAIGHPAGQPDGSASVIAPSDALAVIGANYGNCRADAAELADWQAWYAQQLAAVK